MSGHQHNAQPRPPRGVRNTTRRRGVTLPEVLVVIGILVVLAGLLMPALASVQASARKTIRLDDARQYVLGVTLYADGNNGRTPAFEGETLNDCMHRGYEPLIDIGVYKSREQFDRVGWRLGLGPTFMTAGGLIASPQEFTTTRPTDVMTAPATGVPLASAASPSQKGALWQTRTDAAGEEFWCCMDGDPWNRGVVAFLDGHAAMLALAEFQLPDAVNDANGVGWPVLTTEAGIRGVDRISNK